MKIIKIKIVVAQERLEFEVRRTSATIDEESRSYASFLDDHSASMTTRLQNSIADTTKNNETLVKIRQLTAPTHMTSVQNPRAIAIANRQFPVSIQ